MGILNEIFIVILSLSRGIVRYPEVNYMNLVFI
jgi:hypothetical protein